MPATLMETPSVSLQQQPQHMLPGQQLHIHHDVLKGSHSTMLLARCK